MIQANELRIGNYVNFYVNSLNETYTNGKITAITKDYVYINEIKVNINNIRPIPLTKEWFLKFGFLKEEKYYAKFKIIIELGLGQIFNKGYSFRITTDRYNSTHVCSLKFVHQLQNAFFYANEFKELEVKE